MNNKRLLVDDVSQISLPSFNCRHKSVLVVESARHDVRDALRVAFTLL